MRPDEVIPDEVLPDEVLPVVAVPDEPPVIPESPDEVDGGLLSTSAWATWVATYNQGARKKEGEDGNR